jgi:hypothetical protein
MTEKQSVRTRIHGIAEPVLAPRVEPDREAGRNLPGEGRGCGRARAARRYSIDSVPGVMATPPQEMRAMNGPPKTLSSSLTFYSKVLFPIFCIGPLGVVALTLFSSPSPSPVAWIVLSVVAVGALLLVWGPCIPLKRVRMDDRTLYISNFKTEIAVPLRDVAEVTEDYWTRDHQVTIRLHSDTAFGTKIVFIPKQRWFGWWWSSHPVVGEIRGAVARATGAPTARA